MFRDIPGRFTFNRSSEHGRKSSDTTNHSTPQAGRGSHGPFPLHNLRTSENREFPVPVKIGARAVGWIESEITDFLTAQIERSRSQGGE